jgi:hypothetical protein
MKIDVWRLPDGYDSALMRINFLFDAPVAQHKQVGAIRARHGKHVALLPLIRCGTI